MNEETIIEKKNSVVAATNGAVENKQKDSSWKYVTLGGVPGILLGAGMFYAGQVSAQELMKPDEVEVVEEEEPTTNGEEAVAVGTETDYCDAPSIVPENLHIAHVSDSMSFGEAFAAARAEVGPGGVFYWHGGVYGTYYANEWDAMTAEDKQEFAELVQPEVNATQVPTPTIAVHNGIDVDNAAYEQTARQIADNFDMGEDVHIVGVSNYEGHWAVGYDLDNDGQADVAIINMGSDNEPTPDDIVVNRGGGAVTLGELMEADTTYMADMENPDVATDMPDYMNDANVDPLV